MRFEAFGLRVEFAMSYFGSASPNPWVLVLGARGKKINRHSYETWLQPTRFSHSQGPTLFVRVPNPDFCHIGEKYGDLISEAIENLGLEFLDVEFVTDEQQRPKKNERRNEARSAEELAQLPPISESSGAAIGTARRNSIPSTPLMGSLLVREISLPTLRHALSPNGLRRHTIPCSCTAAWEWARPTSCRPSATRSRSGSRRWRSAICR